MAHIDIGTREGSVEALRRMVRIRAFEQRVGDLFADDEIPGFVHLYLGQEATGVGSCGALADADYITSTHRGHGHSIAKGLDLDEMMAELFGTTAGYCNGKGGSMHIADVDAGMLGANGVVASGVPIGVGAAMVADQQDRDEVALSFCGDGGAAQGQLHEALNMAATWSLPFVLVLENNGYGEASAVDDQHNVEPLSKMAAAYDIPGETVDGMDVERVHEAVSAARTRALEGEGPTFIEAETYRYRGHYEGDPQDYRSEEETEQWRERDPIATYRAELIDRGDLTAEEADEIESEAEAEVDDAVEFARAQEQPEPVAAYEDMYATQPAELEEFADRARTDGGTR